MTSILFICTGNICRSPSADGILRHMAVKRGLDLKIDSCGTHGYHVGEAPDHRAIEVARGRDVDLSFLRARKLAAHDFEDFNLLLAMDRGNLEIMKQQCPPEHAHKLALFLGDQDVPDPYYGSTQDFEHVYDLCYAACESLLNKLN